MDKFFTKLLGVFTVLLLVVVGVFIVVKLLEAIWLQLLILLAILGVFSVGIAVLWMRFRRW